MSDPNRTRRLRRTRGYIEKQQLVFRKMANRKRMPIRAQFDGMRRRGLEVGEFTRCARCNKNKQPADAEQHREAGKHATKRNRRTVVFTR